MARYEGTGESIEAAVRQADMQIPPSDGKDFTVSKVVEWGMQYGGFIQMTLYNVVVEEDRGAPFHTSPSDAGN